ncbi:MAG: DUF1460 domain-containing protein, partial [Gammaproteobacteria bacterium]|nr:DUF1460 domain-containing protein [Gammaproteobacteria bacterium]
NNSKTCSHIQQDPIFRTDQYNCTTLVSMILALIHAKTADNFNKTIVKIEYGAAGKLKDPIHYYNRNNFTSSAFNPINEANHYLENATFKTPFYTIKTVSSVINVQQWLAFQKRASVIQNNIRVLDANNGPTMLARFLNDYPPNLMPLQPQTVTLSYIPKHNLVSCTSLGCTENEIAINALPTPAVIEIVRDDKLWLVDGKPINKLIGSGINVSHIGIIFRKTFIMGAVIYQRITCSLQNQKKVCEVTPIKCNHQLCREVMMLQATDAYPNGYYFYQTHGNYQCTAQKPKSDNAGYTRCNRVLVMPLGDYLSQYEYGIYPFMMAPSIVGLHLEKINY